MNITIRKFHDTAKRNVWCFQDENREIINSKGEINLYNGGWSRRAEAQIVAKQLLRKGIFTSVRYEYIGKDSDGIRTIKSKELKA
tara:strand:+ start:169 stop:423 length:255 start_codon:yes stop_codon:yes gene_type:complete